MRIGIDVGGTNTDAVLMDGAAVLGWRKTPTTADVGTGIIDVLRGLLTETGVAAAAIKGVMIGTTHFTNAIVERRRLVEVAAVRLALPATRSLPPLTDWPADLAAATGRHCYMLHGGNEFDGREIAPLDEAGLRDVARDIRAKGITAAAISSVFSPVTAAMEQRAGAILAAEVPGLRLSLSHEIGRVGFLERENATIMNASLVDLAAAVVSSFRRALHELQITAPFFISQNDGTLMVPTHVARYPVLTFASGPTNSMRGAAFLSGVADAIVVDIGGTTTDVGALHKGFPRQAGVAVEIGGVRTNFRMPDVFSIGLGGGSLVTETAPGDVRVGPRSVGYRLTTDGLAFGGSTLTASDIIIAAGGAGFGDRARVAHLAPALLAAAQQRMLEMVANAVERSRLTPEKLPVIVVGGGSILVGAQVGSLEAVKPRHFAVANAVGAAIAQVSGEIDRVYTLGDTGRAEALADAKAKAIAAAIAAGARADTVAVVDVEDVPLAYLPGNATRIRVKAVGELDV